MQNTRFTTEIDVPREAVFEWHERPGAFKRLVPPWENVELKRFEGIQDGQRAEIRVHVGPLALKWVAEHRDYERGRQFRDVMVKGPFKSWEHTHRMEDADGAGTRLVDEIEYEIPFGETGRRLAGQHIQRRLARQFAYRHRVTRHDVPAYGRFDRQPMKIAMSGASGTIGSALVPFLENGGHRVVPIVRKKPDKGERAIFWNDAEGSIESEHLKGSNVVIHLAGENILEPVWSDQKKMQIHGSRVRSTKLLSETLAGLEQPPDVLICASAIGYYGSRGDEELTETSEPGDDGFLSALTQDWEAASAAAAEAGIRVVHLRFGVVLTPRGGALRTMLLPFRLGLGGCYGRRDQYLSWIAMDDVLHAVYRLIHDPEASGPFNVTSPRPVTMNTFAETLGHVLSRPSFLNVPPAVLRLLYGETADEAILQSARVLPERLQESGYDFLYTDLEEALRHLLGK